MRAPLLTLLLLLATSAHAACPGYATCPAADFPRILAANPQALATLAAIDAQEAATQQTLAAGGQSFPDLVATIGQALVFDRSLSANGTQACARCHGPATGFTAPIAAFARTAGIQPGAIPWRAGNRTPQSLAYAAFAPPLAWRPATHDFAGGNFWDSRATGAVTGSPSADQTATPLVSPTEMALPDPACAVRRLSLAPYAARFTAIWGAQSLAIAWPAGTDRRCARPADGTNRLVLPLHPADRARATLTARQIGLTIAAYEQSALASPFTAKFDSVQAGTARFTAAEARGYALFTGRAHCAACHPATGRHPLFTAFTSANLGLPPNPRNPYLAESAPGAENFIANPQGAAYRDPGLAAVLAASADPVWQAQASRFVGAFQVPTLRNVAVRPSDFPRRFGHNGFIRNLAEMIHFLNTRDVLPRCEAPGGIGVTCWPAPETLANIEHRLTGDLRLSHADEADLLAFLQTLNDGGQQDLGE